MSKWKVQEAKLREANIDTDRLVVVVAGQDTLVGELKLTGFGDPYGGPDKLPHVSRIVDQVITLKNAKRLLTLRMQGPQGIAFNTVVAPFDAFMGGEVSVKPSIAYSVAESDDDTKEQVFGLYAQHLEEMRRMRLAKSGIELASGPLPPNGLPNPMAQVRAGLR